MPDGGLPLRLGLNFIPGVDSQNPAAAGIGRSGADRPISRGSRIFRGRSPLLGEKHQIVLAEAFRLTLGSIGLFQRQRFLSIRCGAAKLLQNTAIGFVLRRLLLLRGCRKLLPGGRAVRTAQVGFL